MDTVNTKVLMTLYAHVLMPWREVAMVIYSGMAHISKHVKHFDILPFLLCLFSLCRALWELWEPRVTKVITEELELLEKM